MTRLERLLETIADRPAGEKVNIPALIRAFTPTQPQIIEAIERLIGTGQLERDTLRRPAQPAPRHGWRPNDVPAVVIVAEIETFLARSGLSKSRFSRECLNDPKFASRLENEAISVRAATATKIRAFIAEYQTPADASHKAKSTEPPRPGAAEDGGGDDRKVAPPPSPWPSGAELVERLQAHIDRHGLSKTAVCRRVFNNAGGMATLKWMRRPRPATIDKIEAFLALPPTDDLKPKCAPLGKNTKGASGTPKEGPSASSSGDATRIEDRVPTKEPAPAVAPLARARPAAAKVDIKVNAPRDPTQRPDTPEMDHAEQERIKAARLAQSYKKRLRTRAQNLLDAGETTGAKGRNFEVRGAMRELRENADAQDRLNDPVEQAKTVIRAARWNCFDAPVKGGPEGQFYIGTRLVDQAQLLAFAERLRTERRRRA